MAKKMNYRGKNRFLYEYGISHPLYEPGIMVLNPHTGMEENKMVFEKPQDVVKGAVPDFKGDGIAIWVKKDKNGKEYLSCCILGNVNIPAWKYDPKPKA